MDRVTHNGLWNIWHLSECAIWNSLKERVYAVQSTRQIPRVQRPSNGVMVWTGIMCRHGQGVILCIHWQCSTILAKLCSPHLQRHLQAMKLCKIRLCRAQLGRHSTKLYITPLLNSLDISQSTQNTRRDLNYTVWARIRRSILCTRITSTESRMYPDDVSIIPSITINFDPENHDWAISGYFGNWICPC